MSKTHHFWPLGLGAAFCAIGTSCGLAPPGFETNFAEGLGFGIRDGLGGEESFLKVFIDKKTCGTTDGR